MDFRTSLETVLTEVHRRQPKDIDMATVALIKAMEFHKSDRFWFNEATWLWTMTAGTYEYLASVDVFAADPTVLSIPSDIQQPISVQIQVGSVWYEPMAQVSIGSIRESILDDAQRGYPDTYAWFKKSMFFYSIPQSAFACRMDYMRDLSHPRYSYDGSAWVFEQRDSVTGIWETLESTYTNDWLNEAEPMIRAWAKWSLYHSMYKDREAAMDAWGEYQIEKDSIEAHRDRFEDGNVRTSVSPL